MPNGSRCGEALGYGPPHFPLADHYARTGDEWMYGRGSHEKLTDSGDWHEHLVLREHRYMLEDTRIGLSLLISVAAMAGVETPLARGFLAIGSAICGEDFLHPAARWPVSAWRGSTGRRCRRCCGEGFA